jgi:hypothetical protein
VAEGVETSDDVAFLRSIGCEFAQGLYYDAPIPQRDVEKMLRKIRKHENRLQRNGMFRTTTKQRAPARDAPVVQADGSGPHLRSSAANKSKRQLSAWSARSRSRKASKRGDPVTGTDSASMHPPGMATRPPPHRQNSPPSRPLGPAPDGHFYNGAHPGAPAPDGPLPPIMDVPANSYWMANGARPVPPPMPPVIPNAAPPAAHPVPPAAELAFGADPPTASAEAVEPAPPPPIPGETQPAGDVAAHAGSQEPRPPNGPTVQQPDTGAPRNGHAPFASVTTDAATGPDLPLTLALTPPPGRELHHHDAASRPSDRPAAPLYRRQRPKEPTLTDFSTLPPEIARSLAKLAKASAPDQPAQAPPPPPAPPAERN